MEQRSEISSSTSDQPSRRWVRVVRVAANTVLWLAALGLFLPVSMGGRVSWVVVSGRSMEPTYHTYDLALVVKGGSTDVGDVIVYRVPDGDPGAGGQVVHRVIGGDSTEGFITQGDNREGPDIWHPRDRDVLGRVVTIVPQGGRFLAMLLNMHNLGLVAVAAVVWALWPRPDDPTGPDDDGDGSSRTGEGAGHDHRPPVELVNA